MNEQVLRPQHLTQVAHEGNPVECFVEVLVATGGLESPNPFTGGDGDDLGGPVLYPRTGSGGPGGDDVGGGDTPTQPIILSADGQMDCAGSQVVTITATGGSAPYAFATTAGNISSVGNVATLTPETNTNPTYMPLLIAFGRVNKFIYSGGCGGTCACRSEYFNCAGTMIQSCSGSSTDNCLQKCFPTGHCAGFAGTTKPDPTFRRDIVPCSSYPAADICSIDAHTICSCDFRDATMQSNGCKPCDVTFHGAVVSVTDGQGHTAYVTVQRNVNVGGP